MKNNFLMLVASICLIGLTIMFYIQMDVGRYVPIGDFQSRIQCVLDTKTGRVYTKTWDYESEKEVSRYFEMVENSKPVPKKK